MAVKSSSFGRVTLTGNDAVKFERQVRYGKPTAAAKASVSRGIELAKEFRESSRSMTFKVTAKR